MAEKKIGDRTFKVEPLLARDSLRLVGRLLKVAGPAWDKLRGDLDIMEGGERDKAAFLRIAGDSVVSIMMSNTTDEVVDLVADIAACAQCRAHSGSYDTVDLDLHFTDRLDDLPVLIRFVLEENFARFFAGKSRSGTPQTRKAA